MASTEYTPNLGLCKWSGSDKPKRADFVSDNTIIDSTVGSHIANTTMHVTSSERAKFTNPYTIVSYVGDGESTKEISIANSPKLALVVQKYYPPVTVDNNGNTLVRSGLAYYGTGSTSGITISNNKVTVSQDTQAQDGRKNCLNEEYGQYMLILFR